MITSIAVINTSDLVLNPIRFQYKLIHAKTGETGTLTGVIRWNKDLAGIVLVWLDPEDGKIYVVNGHNRIALAIKLGVKQVLVRYLVASSAKEARFKGALVNIAEGCGTVIDAAKFFRDSSLSEVQLREMGIAVKGAIARDAISLSNLERSLFSKVVQGELELDRGIVIGSLLSDYRQQVELVQMIERQESRRKRAIAIGVVREMAEQLKSAPVVQMSLFDLFGTSEQSHSLAIEKAELIASIRSQLSQQKRLFSTVSKKAKMLEDAGNFINRDTSKAISKEAGYILQVFDQLKNQSGEVSRLINLAVGQLAAGANKETIEAELLEAIQEEIVNLVKAA